MATLNGQLEDAFFGYDHFDLSRQALTALRRDAEVLRAILREFPAVRISVEGHGDERGSAEYSLGLGDRRATRALEFRSQLGLAPANLAAVSYGKEAPQCVESAESCLATQSPRPPYCANTSDGLTRCRSRYDKLNAICESVWLGCWCCWRSHR